jgi:hypothetical protein
MDSIVNLVPRRSCDLRHALAGEASVHRDAIKLAILPMLVLTAPAQTRREREILSIQAYPAEATAIQFQNRVYVDVRDLARTTNGSPEVRGEWNHSGAARWPTVGTGGRRAIPLPP